MSLIGYSPTDQERSRTASGTPRDARVVSGDVLDASISKAIATLSRNPTPSVTKRSAAWEESFTLERLNHIRARSTGQTRSATLSRPVLWVDGPLDFALTVYALTQSGSLKKAKGEVAEKLRTDAAKERLEKIFSQVEALPFELTRTGEAKNRPPRIKAGNSFQAFLNQRTGALIGTLPNTGSRLRTAMSRAHNSLQAFARQKSTFETVGGIIANSATIPLTLGHNDWSRRNTDFFNDGRRTQIEKNDGPARADLAAAQAFLFLALRSAARSANQGVPVDLHQVYNFNAFRSLANYQVMNEVIRNLVPGNRNFRDEFLDVAEEFVYGVTGWVQLSTLDVACRAPTEARPEESVFNLKNIDDVLAKPTVSWADGTEFSIYDGIELSRSLAKMVIEKPSELLNVGNVEQRRALLRLIGHEKLLADVKATLVAEDDFGKLFVLPNGAQFTIVQNATPEPDGSVREYVLGAVGKHRNARSAVASTWGLREEQYYPAIET